MDEKIFFLSKDANWQLYRNETLTKLAFEYKYDVSVLTTGDIKEHIKENERLKYIKFKNWFSAKQKLSFFPGAILYILKNRPYGVLAVNNSTQLTEYLTVILCRLFGIKFIWWTHAYDHNPKRTGFVKKFKDWYTLIFLKLSNAVITFSYEGRNYLINKGAKEYKVFTALNTLDTEKLLSLKKRVAENFDKENFLSAIFNEDDNKNGAPITLLFSGRLKKDKKVDNAIRAIKLLKERGINARLIVVGDGECMNELVALAKELDITGKIYFAGFVFDEVAVSQYFLASDIFIMPGYIGLAIIHAFAFGLPVITENISIHSPEIQYLKNGENGYKVKENDIEDAVTVITKIKAEPQLLSALKSGALQTVENEANIFNMIKNMNSAITLK